MKLTHVGAVLLVVAAPWIESFCDLAPQESRQLLGLAGHRARAQSNLQRLYSNRELQLARRKYSRPLRGTWSDIIGRLPPQYRQHASTVRLELPLRGQLPSPLACYSTLPDRHVHVPIRMVKFFDDIATVMTMREERGCTPGAVLDYVGMLATRRSGVPAPLTAFGLPADAYKSSSYVYDVSGKMLKSALYFILLHELAHVLLGHPGNKSTTPAVSQRNEQAADRFALEEMGRIGVPPMGMAFFFTASARYEPPPGSRGADAFAKYAETFTHPLSAARIDALATGVRARASLFASSSSTALIQQVVANLKEVAKMLNDTKARNAHNARSRLRPLSTLTRCESWPVP